MDELQVDRIQVFGFVHALLRSPNPIQVFRAIEPPDVAISTSLTASLKSFRGGPFLVKNADGTKVMEVKSRHEFENVTVGTLAADHVLDNVFRLVEPTKILVLHGLWGRTDVTLDAMKIPYDITTRENLAANPHMISAYSLIVIDCYGWNGNMPSQVVSALRTHIDSGNEVIFTDIALKDLDSTFPGYVTLWGPQPRDRIANAYGYSLARRYDPTKYGSSADRFTPEFLSQYYASPPNPNDLKVFTESAGYVISSIPSARVNDVRILVDSMEYGAADNEYAILAFYFEYGNGIVEGLAFHPQQQVKSTVGDNSYYATYQIYGNKLLHRFAPIATTTQTSTPITTTTTTQVSTVVTSTTATSTSTMSVIRGTIYWYDVYGNLCPVAWAQVTAAGEGEAPTVTSSTTDGTYMMWVAPGTYSLSASRDPGFIPQAQNITVPEGGVVVVDFSLQPSGLAPVSCSVTTTQSTTTAGTTVTETSTVISTTTVSPTATTMGLQMQVVSNSSVSGLVFDSAKGLLNFTVSGPTGTYGFFDATIAKTLLSGQPIVMIDGMEHPASVTEDTNFWYIHVTYSHSEHQITIGGSNTIPEFPPIPLLAIIFILAMIILRRRTKYLTTFNSQSPFHISDRLLVV